MKIADFCSCAALYVLTHFDPVRPFILGSSILSAHAHCVYLKIGSIRSKRADGWDFLFEHLNYVTSDVLVFLSSLQRPHTLTQIALKIRSHSGRNEKGKPKKGKKSP